MKSIKRIFLFSVLVIFVFMIVFFIFMCFADAKVKPVVVEKKATIVMANSFKTGESIFFGVYSNGIKVGSGQLVYQGVKKYKGLDLQHITFKISTFSVNDEENVYGTLDFSAPVFVNRKVRLFGRQEEIAEEYSHDRKSVRILKSVNGKLLPEQIVQSSESMTNVFLLIYSLRNDKNLNEGSSFRIVLPTQSFDLKAQSIRMIRVPKGRFEAYYLESSPAKYRVWLDKGKERLPVRIQGLAAGGMMYLALLDVR